MNKVRIALVSAGSQKYPVDVSLLERRPSDLMTIRHAASIGHLPDATGSDWHYPDAQLGGLIQRESDSDITVALINAPLENNYYMRRLGNNVVVLSLYEMAEIIRAAHFTIEDYIVRNLYEILVLFVAENRTIPLSAHTWAHDEVRGCLFDISAYKPDIVFSMHRPTLCHSCRNRVLENQVDHHFLPLLEKELRGLQKALFFRIEDWVKDHPLLALTCAAAASIILNLIASVLFEGAKACISH